MSAAFSGKVVAITGAAGGIGQELARHFARQGAAIAALDHKEAVIDFTHSLQREGFTASAAVADVTSPAAVRDAFEQFGEVHLLINNVGYSTQPTLSKTDPDGWRAHLDGNLNGAFSCAHAVLPGMVNRRAGGIINIGSINGLYGLGDPAYSAAKAGLISFTKSLAMEYGRYGIRANIVLPGTVRTPLWDERIRKDPATLERLKRWYPLGRIVEPAEVAQLVIFLASEQASAITGAVIPIDCGLSAGNLVMTRELILEDF